ncbi:MAG: epoxyqueuosine reductase [Deltaproteobacteria bacterium]|nr:MAG: epoxyqueuosine reductase [Deltaproteobacteria bacterium]
MNCALAHPKKPKTKNRPKNELPHGLRNTEKLKSFIRTIGVELTGIADLDTLEKMPVGMSLNAFREHYRYAIVMGAPLGRLEKEAPGIEASIYLEKAALEVVGYLEAKSRWGLVIHTEDEFDPINRTGLMSLKVLAKAAGLGWQGRSLLIVSPSFGPIHRLIAVLTDMPLKADTAIPNQCGDCSACIRECPARALTLVTFEDHPHTREEVLNLHACLGDHGCKACLVACPYQQNACTNDNRQERCTT